MKSAKQPTNSALKYTALPDSAWAALLVVGVMIAYIPAMHGDFVWDDDAYVIDNQTLRSLDGLRRIWLDLSATPQYYPLVHTTFWCEYQLWGLQPAGYHAANVILHALNAVLLWRILVFLNVPGAWLAAAVFGLHPVHVESVAWITERKNVLSGFFYLSSAYCYLRFALGDRVRHGKVWYVAALTLFVGALLSKTVTASLPAALALVLWWRRGRLERRDWLSLLPMFVVGIGFGLLTAWLEREHVGAQGPEWDLSFVERCLIAGRAVWFYLYKLIVPVNLAFIYPRWHIDESVWWQYLFPLLAIVLLAACWQLRQRFGLGPLVAVLFFGGTLLPALGFINVFPMRYSFVADHFQYLASIGIISLVIGFVTGAGQQRLPPTLKAAASLGVLAALFMLSWEREFSFMGMEALWRDTLERNPRAAIAHHGLGYIHDLRGEGAFHAGDTNSASREWRLAEEHYRAAIALDPHYWESLYDLALLQIQQERLDEAIMNLAKTLHLQPDRLLVRETLGSALLQAKRFDQAIDHFQEMLRLAPNNGKARNGLAEALNQLKKRR